MSMFEPPEPDPLVDRGWICPECEFFLSIWGKREARLLGRDERGALYVLICPNGCRPDAWIPAGALA